VGLTNYAHAHRHVVEAMMHHASSVNLDARRGRNRGMGLEGVIVKVFDSVETALASIRSAALRNQLLRDLGMLQTKFID
jgi:hypothetical protein